MPVDPPPTSPLAPSRAQRCALAARRGDARASTAPGRPATNGRFNWLPIVLLLAACGGEGRSTAPAERAAPAEAAAGSGPDVFLISVDTLRADRLGCYGYRERPTSPHIDALAADGVLFEDVVAASSWTTPAHATMLTGRRPSTHGVTMAFFELKRDLTGGGRYARIPPAHATLAERLAAAGYRTGAFTAGGTLHPDIGFGRGYERYGTSMHKLDAGNVGELLAWIDAHPRPAHLFWHSFEVHAPYLRAALLEAGGGVDRADVDAIRTGLARLRHLPGEYVAMGRRPQAQRRGQRDLLAERDAFDAEVCEQLYLSGVRSFDRWLGRFVDHLKRAGRYEGALVVLTSDHGEEFAEHDPERFYDAHGHSLYQEVVRVPLIVKLPGRERAGTRVRALARTVDVMPTILDTAGVADPADLDGASLRPLWEGQTAGERIAVAEGLATAEEKKALRRGRYKYIVTVGADQVAARGRAQLGDPPAREELYDLEADPHERRNLIAAPSKAARETARALRRLLAERVGAAAGAPRGSVPLSPETVQRLEALGYAR